MKPYHEIPCSNNQPWHIDTDRGQLSFTTELDAENAIKLADRVSSKATQELADIVVKITTNNC